MQSPQRAWDLRIDVPAISKHNQLFLRCHRVQLGHPGGATSSKNIHSVATKKRTKWICSPLMLFRGKSQSTLEIVARCMSEA